MEITDEIKDKDEKQDAENERDLFFAMLNGQTVKETIDTTRGQFVVKFPKQKDMLAIDRRIAAMRYGLNAASYDNTGNFNIQKVAFLDVVVESGPAWYEAAKKKNEGISWGDMPDTTFVDEVYVKAWTFRNEVQEKLKHTSKSTDAKSPAPDRGESMDATVGDGLFSAVAATSNGD